MMQRTSTFLKIMAMRFAAMVFFLATDVASFAGETPLGGETTGTEEMTTAVLKMLGSLILVIGVIATLFYVARKVRSRVAGGGRTARMQLIETLSIAPKRWVALVEVQNQWLILGVGPDEVRFLTRLPRPAESEITENRSSTHDGFQSILKRNMVKGWISGNPKGGKHDPA